MPKLEFTHEKKQHKSQPVQKKAQIHIQLEDPVATRREILTCALDTAKLMKEAHELAAIKERKIKQ